ncbi:hypothetical protein GQ43DRAFT_489525 [Delitschia confertaspora ATCC 74209]|uniref:AB hydrolase-1 domain-containing protein n=1 Tax=Delitschia confertaspora ATCC 74209 TaxID=1513339 RepID=A0A9P4MXZ8_9PLEO|nr:hypothetical protein GQ43DRAFT_489525 [Delitschia confertaspora ATCC 74209]
MGGIYGPEAASGGLSKRERVKEVLRGGVVAMVFCAAVLARKGGSAIQSMELGDGLLGCLKHDTTGMVAITKSHTKEVLFHDLPEPEAERLSSLLPAQPYACFSTLVQWDPYDDPAFQACFAYIYTEADRIVPMEVQRVYVETTGVKRTCVLEGSSHSPHIKRPGTVAEMVVGLLEALLGR